MQMFFSVFHCSNITPTNFLYYWDTDSHSLEYRIGTYLYLFFTLFIISIYL